MLNKLIDKTARVAVVDNSAATRQLLSETVKSFGFPQVHGMASIKDLIQFMETDDTDIVICSLEATTEFNALNLLNLITKNPDLRHLRICLLVDEDDEFVIPKAFELGAIGLINKPFTKESLKQAFAQMVNEAELHQANEALVAATFLRPALEKIGNFEAWIDFEKKMLKLFPGSTSLLINLGEALLTAGKRDEAAQVLNQAVLIDPSLEDQAEIVFSKTGDGSETLATRKSSGGTFNALGLDRIVVVDSDETMQTAISDILKEIGAADVQCFSDGVTAAEYIKENPDPHLIIQEWRIPKLSGPMFVQRVVQEGAANTPIIVLSSLVQPKDMPLIREMGVANVVQKPFDRTEFVKCLIWTIQQERMPTEQQTLEIKIRKLLKNGDHDEADQMIARFMEDPRIAEARKKLIQAERDYANLDYESAKTKCIAALKSSADSVQAFTLLGRSLIKLRDFDGALKCLEKAQSLSPNNIERLCNIAESQTETGDIEAAEATADQAADMDPDSVMVNETQAKVAIASGDLDEAKKIMSGLDALENIISYMNNKAVAYARTDRFDESLEEYEKTVKALPDDKVQLKSMVLYNHALALARAGKLDQAVEKIDLVLAQPSDKVKAKASSLKMRLTSALDKGTPFQLMASAAENAPDVKKAKGPNGAEVISNDTVQISEILPNPGDIGCYMIYEAPPPDAKITGLLKVTLSFTARSGITREETMKAGGKKAG